MLAKRLLLSFSALLVMMLVAACGSSTSTGGGTTPTPTTPAATATTAPTATAATTSAVQTATATVGGQSETILTNAQGETLYYFTSDGPSQSACTGGCAKVWPPLVFSGSGSPTSSATLPGMLSVLNEANGNQVEYSGYLLYTYSGDTAPGQTNGEGLFGKWFVATPAIAAFVIRVATATVQGKSTTILTNAQGETLYYFTPDSATNSACTGGCAKVWPPLAFSGSGSPLGDAPLSGKLTVLSDANGSQVEYNDHPLYVYSGDTAPGQTNGEGLFGKWFVCTPSVPAA